MNKSEQEGYFLISGERIPHKQLAGLINATEKEVSKLIDELRTNKVFSETPEGVIYCRRILREKDERAKFQAFGKQGGNPALKPNHTVKVGDTGPGGVNPPVGSVVNPVVNGEDKATHKLQESEARVQESESEKETGGTGVGSESGSPAPRERARRPTPLHPDWQPSIALIAFGLSLGLSELAVSAGADRMRDWSKSEGKIKADWDATFRNWLRKDADTPRAGRSANRGGAISEMQRKWKLESFCLPIIDEEDEPVSGLRTLQ